MQGSDHWVEGIEVMARCMHNNHASDFLYMQKGGYIPPYKLDGIFTIIFR